MLAKLNRSDLKVAAMDGDLTLDFASRLFPLVKLHQISSAAEYTQLYMDVAQGKADFVVNDPVTSQLYMDNNPGKLKRLALSNPVAILPNQLSVLRGQEALADLLSQGVHNMQQRGLDREILDAFDKAFPNTFFRVAPAYIQPVAKGK
ncbi:MAG: transporter substrate-binding domain-containing protein [Bdellovibrionales bacterium]